jgi:hypothetical protein
MNSSTNSDEELEFRNTEVSQQRDSSSIDPSFDNLVASSKSNFFECTKVSQYLRNLHQNYKIKKAIWFFKDWEDVSNSLLEALNSFGGKNYVMEPSKKAKRNQALTYNIVCRKKGCRFKCGLSQVPLLPHSSMNVITVDKPFCLLHIRPEH